MYFSEIRNALNKEFSDSSVSAAIFASLSLIFFAGLFSFALYGLPFFIGTERAFAHSPGPAPGTNVTSTYPNFFGWNDLIGWMDFHYTHTITVSSFKLTGYASSSAGEISLDCETTPIGNICPLGQSDPRYYRVVNDGCGTLSGWAWNDTYGWVSMCGNPGGTNGCAATTVNYGVNIDTNGNFSGWAWNDIAGWLSFCGVSGGAGGTCANISPGNEYKVQTDWRPTSTQGILESSWFDTSSTNAQLNYFVWYGNVGGSGLGCGGAAGTTNIRFQFASANDTSTAIFIGDDGTGNTYYTADTPGAAVRLNWQFHRGRYFRYRAILDSDQAQSVTPRIDDVIVNWSP